jgi:hypothetical protein
MRQSGDESGGQELQQMSWKHDRISAELSWERTIMSPNSRAKLLSTNPDVEDKTS